METNNATIVLGENQPLYRLGLRAILNADFGFNDVADAGCFAELLSVLAQQPCTFMVVNLDLPGMNGVAGIRHLRQHFPDARVIVLSGRSDRGTILESLSAGAHGFIMKTMTDDAMADAIRTVVDGRVYVPSLIAEREADRPIEASFRGPKLQDLTNRQRQVLEQMAFGKSNKQIARYFGIAESTVKVHLNAAFNILGVHNRVSAMTALHELDARLHAEEPTHPGLLDSSRRAHDLALLLAAGLVSATPSDAVPVF